MKIKLLVGCVFLGMLSVHAQTPQDRTKTLLSSAMRTEHIPGLAYAVIDHGKVRTQGTLGLANLSWGKPVDEHTAFQLASVSKIYCGILLCRLFDAKVLSPDQKLATLIDSIPPAWNDITVLQLGAHQSGIKMAAFGRTRTAGEALALAKQMPFEFAPGEKSAYVSSDYWILQYIIEKATGLAYYDALKEYVLQPLHMTDTYVNGAGDGLLRLADVIPKEATVYHYFKNEDRYRSGDFIFSASGYASGGIFTSLNDVIKLMVALDEGEFLAGKWQQLLLNNVSLNNGQTGEFGLGWIIRDYQGHAIAEHSGGPALADIVRFKKEGLTVIVLSNQRGFYPYLAKAVATIYVPGLKMPEVP